jgi:hypothetical protein
MYTSLPARASAACEKASDSEIPRRLSKYAQESWSDIQNSGMKEWHWYTIVMSVCG